MRPDALRVRQDLPEEHAAETDEGPRNRDELEEKDEASGRERRLGTGFEVSNLLCEPFDLDS